MGSMIFSDADQILSRISNKACCAFYILDSMLTFFSVSRNGKAGV